jgi:hypothetical protein
MTTRRGGGCRAGRALLRSTAPPGGGVPSPPVETLSDKALKRPLYGPTVGREALCANAVAALAVQSHSVVRDITTCSRAKICSRCGASMPTAGLSHQTPPSSATKEAAHHLDQLLMAARLREDGPRGFALPRSAPRVCLRLLESRTELHDVRDSSATPTSRYVRSTPLRLARSEPARSCGVWTFSHTIPTSCRSSARMWLEPIRGSA